MAKQQSASVEVKLRDVRLSFPHLWDAVKFEDKAEPKYSASFIFLKGSETHKDVVRAIKAILAAQWPAGKPKGLEHCLHDGDEKEQLDGYGSEMMYLPANNEMRIPIYDVNKRLLVKGDGKPYGGCYVNANVRLWAQQHQRYGSRINAQLLGVQFVRDGDAFGGGRVSSADDFDDLTGGTNPLGDDDIDF